MSPDLEDYIEAHISPEPENLKKIDRETNLYNLNGRMCSGHIQGRLLKMLTAIIAPKNVIELGTFTGYSALCMAEALAPDAKIHTIEADDELEETIIKNLSLSAEGRKVILHIGDALEVMKEFSDNSFDMAVIDADKREYTAYFKEIMRLVKCGGIILADNTLWDGHVTEPGKHSSQTQGILDFNNLVINTSDVEVAMIPIRDGLTLIRKCDAESITK